MAERNANDPAGFLVEDFITSITTQLDRVQDALRIKAVNRPLTYALKELHLELKVFVDMDAQGQVLLRAAGPNEVGASMLAMDFTTITKPMIEENTISLGATRSTPLDHLGLKPEEQMRLERLGVTNLAQLDRLRSSTGVATVARLADMPIERLRRALQVGRPKLGGVSPAPATPPLVSVPPVRLPPRGSIARPPVSAPPTRPSPVRSMPPPKARSSIGVPPDSVLRRPSLPRMQSEGIAAGQTHENEPDFALSSVLEVPPTSRSLTIPGTNLQHEAYPPAVRLNGVALEIEELDDDRIVVRLPEGFEEGALEVALGDEAPHCFTLVHPLADAPDDPWTPAAEHRHET